VGTVDGYEAALSALTSLQQQTQPPPTPASLAPPAPPTATPRDRKRKQADKPDKPTDKPTAKQPLPPTATAEDDGPSPKRPKPLPQDSTSSAEGGEGEERPERFFVFIKHLGGKVYENELRTALEGLLGGKDNVLRVLVSTDPKTKRPKGSAVVQLASPDVQQQAIGKTILGLFSKDLEDNTSEIDTDRRRHQGGGATLRRKQGAERLCFVCLYVCVQP
jgi:hypothetical protein